MVCFFDAQASWGCMVGEQVADSVALRGQEAFITSGGREGIPEVQKCYLHAVALGTNSLALAP